MKIAIASYLKNIWVPPAPHRPYWTIHNKKGNAAGDLTNRELRENRLGAFTRTKFSLLEFESKRFREMTRKEKVIDWFCKYDWTYALIKRFLKKKKGPR